jgi:cell division transport system permease protein
MSAYPGAGGLRRALALIGAHLLAWCGAVLAGGLSMAAILLAAGVALGLRPLLVQGGPPVQATVWISSGAGESDALRASLGRLDAVDSVAFVSRDAALAQLAARSAADREAIAQLAANPLPDAFVVTFRADASADAVDSAAGAIRKLPRVDGVQLDLSWYRKLRAALRLARFGSLAALAFVGTSAVGWLLVAVSVCLRIDPVQVRLLRLLGADDRLIRRPAVIAGSISALAIGLVAVGAARYAWSWIDGEAAALASLYSSPLRVRWPDFSWLALVILGLLVAGTSLASIGARLRLAAVPAQGRSDRA